MLACRVEWIMCECIISVFLFSFFFFFKQKTAYEMRISDWSSDVCSSDLRQFPEAGIDPIDRFMPAEDARDGGGARRNGVIGGAIEHHRRTAPDRPPVGEPHRARPDRHAHCPLQMR